MQDLAKITNPLALHGIHILMNWIRTAGESSSIVGG